jgi:hypothetical protein
LLLPGVISEAGKVALIQLRSDDRRHKRNEQVVPYAGQVVTGNAARLVVRQEAQGIDFDAGRATPCALL